MFVNDNRNVAISETIEVVQIHGILTTIFVDFVNKGNNFNVVNSTLDDAVWISNAPVSINGVPSMSCTKVVASLVHPTNFTAFNLRRDTNS
jgi:hypothetical protein